MILSRPSYGIMPVAAALAAPWSGWHLSRKADGVCVRREWNGCAVWGDAMRDGRLMVWEIERAFGEEVAALPWAGGREAALAELFANLNPKLNWHRCATGHGAEFIEAMIDAALADNTPDVVVAKPLDAPFGAELVKVKLAETFDVTVADATGGSLSVAIEFEGQPAGRCPVASLAALESLRAGDVIEIVAACRLPSGKFREPRFLRARPDKA